MHTILIVDDKRHLLEVLSMALENMGYTTIVAESAEQALAILDKQKINLVLTDLRLPGMDGKELLAKIKSINPALPVILMTAYASVKDAVEFIKNGAYDYIVKPFDLHALEVTVTGALRFFDFGDDNRKLRKALGCGFSDDQLIGISPAMEAVRQSIKEVGPRDSNVLILGESGTGKELIAKAIHHNSKRSDTTLITVNCAAIPEALLESELFGHVKGAFTGATANRPGRFILADKGSLLLDEIGDMPLFLQAKLLRVLQDKIVEPVGANEGHKVDIRIIAATNQDLITAVAQGTFRHDLYYRLNVYPICVPPLREHKEDIPLLLEYFASNIAAKTSAKPLVFTEDAVAILQTYEWPGNVRELENFVERLTIITSGDLINEDFLKSFFVANGKHNNIIPTTQKQPTDVLPQFPLNVQQKLEEYERDLVLKALEKSGGVQIEAARLLEISERSMWHRIKKLGIQINKRTN